MNTQEINSENFQELLKIINCMGYSDYHSILGERLTKHLHTRIEEHGLFYSLLTLDASAMDVVYAYACAKLNAYNEKKQNK